MTKAVNQFGSFDVSAGTPTAGTLEPIRRQVAQNVFARSGRSRAWELAIGIGAGLLAIAIRAALPLKPEQLPTLPVVVMLAIVTTFVGWRAGIATAITGGLLSWYLFFNEYSWSLANGAWIPLMGFAVIAAVIVTTSQLYRTSEQRSHGREMALLRVEAERARFFAREMAHRQRNTLAIVQSIAFQTIGTGSDEAAAFAGRLKTLADANALLDEHVEQPSAGVPMVIEAALGPFRAGTERFEIASADATISAQNVVSLALALHELATNAVKYGALSCEEGRVSLTIDEDGDRLAMTWKEHGGPAVVAPQRTGFGTRILQGFGMDTELAFEPDGLRCAMTIRKS